MEKRTDILNHLAHNHDLKSYCEIGLQNRASNFNKIKCPAKYCVDPDPAAKADFIGTSDAYFAQSNTKFDLFFLDGLHHADQIKKDVINALANLNEGGFIVIHDCLPVHEIHAKVPRESKIWNGDVYKLCFDIVCDWGNVLFTIVDIDHGCGVIWKQKDNLPVTYPDSNLHVYDWEYYETNRHILPIITARNFAETL